MPRTRAPGSRPTPALVEKKAKRRTRSGLAKSKARWGIAITLPTVILVAVFVVIPIGQSIFYSFTDWNGVTATNVGLSNYASSIFSGPGVHRILFNNLVFVISVPIAVFIEYCIAYTLWAGIRGQTALRIIYFIPVILSWAIVGIVFRTMLLQFAPTWLANQTLALVVIILAFHWTTMGVNILIMYAGLSTVDKHLLEAARIDGAGQISIMLRIVFPQILSFVDFAVITSLILCLTNIFGLIYAFNFGGPGFATTTLEFNLYQDGFTNGNFGLAAATGILLMIISIAVSLVRVVPTVRRFRR